MPGNMKIPQAQLRWIRDCDFDPTSENIARHMPFQLQQLHITPEGWRWFPVPIVNETSDYLSDERGYPQ